MAYSHPALVIVPAPLIILKCIVLGEVERFAFTKKKQFVRIPAK